MLTEVAYMYRKKEKCAAPTRVDADCSCVTEPQFPRGGFKKTDRHFLLHANIEICGHFPQLQ